ncbi:MAG TPA: hypothetical protein VK548_01570 [Candidatus Acidoferrum sp.]|nr:hypothetical protein [Candidatus Acidoferrum sp.]
MTMETTRRLGIWMDHSVAHLMDVTTDSMVTSLIESESTHRDREHSLSKSENLMHNKEQHQLSEFYKKLGEAITHYQDVLLFGPTSAKTELLNVLRADHRFAKIKIEVEDADKMTTNQLHAFVTKHFTPAQ